MIFLDTQLREHSTALTIAVFCFLFISSVLMICIPTFFTMWDQQNIDDGLYPESMSLVMGNNPVIPQWVFDIYGYLDELMWALFIWWVVNVLQMWCLAIDEVMRTRNTRHSCMSKKYDCE